MIARLWFAGTIQAPEPRRHRRPRQCGLSCLLGLLLVFGQFALVVLAAAMALGLVSW